MPCTSLNLRLHTLNFLTINKKTFLDNKKHILLIAYVFPPYFGIGGRRWAKHADELTKLGYIVHVICAKNPFKETSLWSELVEKNTNILVCQLPSRYPNVLVDFNHNFFQKIKYKFWVSILPFLTKGSYLDRTIFWKYIMLRKAKKIIKQYNINHVICTGGPFGIMQQVTELKKWFHSIYILNDMRDPWTWGPNWGFPNLEKKRMSYEKKLERETIQNSDLISVPNLEMQKSLQGFYPEFKDKIIQLPHFYDEAELCTPIKTHSEKIRLVYYGNIYHTTEALLEQMVKFFGAHQDKFTFDIYTVKTMHLKYVERYKADNIKTFPQLSMSNLIQKFNNYDFVFIATPSYSINNISTKFYEIIYSKTPIILFCEKGLAGEFLESNKLGMQVEPSNLEEKMLALYTNNTFIFNSNYNISNFEIKNIVKQIDFTLKESNEFEKVDLLQKKETKNILITFDYELFLGKLSGTVVNCIIKPTNAILNILQQNNITKSLFFVDTIYIKRLLAINNEEAKNDYNIIEAQLCDILKKGHLIYPHIHSHWLDAIYDENINQWTLPNIKKYRFHHITNELQNELFDFSIQFIKTIQQKASVTYAINSYRAGGWCIQPFTGFKPLFIKHGIVNDFSVLKKFSNLSNDLYYNFINIPNKPIYNFENDVTIETKNGSFKEYSISWLHINSTKKLINKFYLKYLTLIGNTNLGDGISVAKVIETDEYEMSLMIDNLSIAEDGIEMASIELLKLPKLSNYKDLIDNNKFTHFISHPKMINSHNLFCFDKLLKSIKNKYEIETDFEKMN